MKKIIVLLLVVFVSSLLLTGCSTISTQETEWPKTVKVGVIAPLSGPASIYGEDIVNTFNYSVEQFNKAHEDQIKLIIEDGKCSWKDSNSAAQKLIMVDNVDVILWWACSSETLAAGQIAQQNQVPLLSALSSAPEITDMGDYVFRFYSDISTAEILAKNLNATTDTVAIIFENTDYSTSLHKKFKEYYKGDIMLEERFNSDEKDFGILVSRLKDKGFDALVLINQTESTAVSIIKTLEQKNMLEDLRGKIYGQYMCSSQSFLEELWSLAEWMYCTDVPPLESLDQKSKDFVEGFKKLYKVNAFDSWIAYNQEAIDLIFDAMNQWFYTRESIKNYLASITSSQPRKWYLGRVYFDKNWDLVWLNAIMEQVVDGEIQVLN